MNYTNIKQSFKQLGMLLLILAIGLNTGCKKDDEETPCNQPGNLTTSNVTGTTAQLSWDAASPEPSGYEWQVVSSGTQPGSNSVISGTTGSAATTAQATGLTASTDYDFYVRATCDGNVSGWAGPGAFSTISTTIEPPIYICDSFGTNLDQDLTLVDRPNAPVDYVIDCILRVNANLAINSGVVVEMGADAGIEVRTNGTLSAVGTAAAPITFRGVQETKGYWAGIANASTSTTNEMSYVSISHAGSRNVIQGGPTASFYNNTSGTIKFNNNTLALGGGYGVFNTLNSELVNYANNTITTHDEFPVQIHANDFHQLDGTGSSYTGNTKDMIEMSITAGSVITVVDDQTWKNPGVPVIQKEGTIGVRADLVVEPGFELVCRPDCNLTIDDAGSFNAVGTAAMPIIIRGEQSTQGYWNGMYLDGTSTLNKLDHVKITDGGREKPFGAAGAKANLYISQFTTNLTISNSEFSNSLECGIYTSNAGVSLSNNTYNNNMGNDVCP